MIEYEKFRYFWEKGNPALCSANPLPVPGIKNMNFKKPIAKFFGTRKSNLSVDWENVHSVLIRPIGTGLGDAVVLSAVCKQLKNRFPQCRIGVIGCPRNRPVLENNPFIDVFVADNLFSAFFHRRKWQFFLDYRPTFTTYTILFDYILSATTVLCFQKHPKKHYSAQTVHNYDLYIDNLSATHLANSLSLTPWAMHCETVSYTLPPLPQQALDKAHKLLSACKNTVVFFPFGTDRKINPSEVTEIISQLENHFGRQLVCLFPFDAAAYPISNHPSVIYTGALSTEVFMALIKQAPVLVSVDSAPVHLAAAYGTACAAIYDMRADNFVLFGPIAPTRSFRATKLQAQNTLADIPVAEIVSYIKAQLER